MQLVIPMAGLGRRFKEAGYRLPKPLLPVAGLPLAVRVARSLPHADRTVFVCRADHLRDHAAESALRRYVPGCELVAVHGSTEGPACSARLACDRLHDGPVLLAGCDRLNVYDPHRFEELTATEADCIVWTYRHEPRVLVCPEDHSWADVGPNGRVRHISVRVPLSDWQYLDHACAGVLWFRSATVFREGIDALLATGKRSSGEFHPEAAAGLLARQGGTVLAFEVDKHVSFASPDELAEFRRWEACLARLAG